MIYLLLFVGVIFNIIISFWIASVKFNQIKRDKTYIQEMRAEIAEFMSALEQNVAGYVGLMERMQREADGVLENVNRKLRVIEKESQKLEQSRQTYNELSKRKPVVSSVLDVQKGAPMASSSYADAESDTHRATLDKLSKQLRDSASSATSGGLASSADRVASQLNKAPHSASKIRPNEQIAIMWREGKEAKEIAEKLNLSMGEVELALELMGSRRS